MNIISLLLVSKHRRSHKDDSSVNHLPGAGCLVRVEIGINVEGVGAGETLGVASGG